MLRAVVADDSPTVRSLLKQVLESDPEIQVVGLAKDGVEAVELVQSLRPDVVTMDVQMPRMNGFEATKEIMITAPTRIVIVTASIIGHDVSTAMHALSAGALTLLIKPPGPDDPGFEAAARELVATVKAMTQVKVVRHHRAKPPATPTGRQAGLGVVAIAASTGGPQALQKLLSELPRDFPAPLLVAQHISAGFTAGLAGWLGQSVPMRVKVAEAGEPLAASTVYVAPEDWHLGVSPRKAIALSADPPIGGFRPSGTHLFQSVAAVYGPAAVAIVLTGMGDDGAAGLPAIKTAGGRVLAQDEASCVVFGMPAAAIRSGLADRVLPLDKIAHALTDMARA
jgi:two-component system, chemotaxis family, protein-glutamate methylesterase/glutaminase